MIHPKTANPGIVRVALWLIIAAPFIIFPAGAYSNLAGPTLSVRAGAVMLLTMFIFEKRRPVFTPILLALLGYMVATLVVVLASPNVVRAWESTPDRLSGGGEMLLWALAAMVLARFVHDWRLLASKVVVMAMVMVVLGAIWNLLGYGAWDRLYFPTSNPGFLAVYLVGALPAAVAFSARVLPSKLGAYRFMPVALIVVGIGATGSRAAIIGALVGLGVFMLHRRTLPSLKSALLSLLVLSAVVAVVALWRMPQGELLVGDSERIAWWGVAVEKIAERPLTGWGPAGFYEAADLYDHNGHRVDFPHNLYIGEVLDRGLLAIPSFLLVLAVGWRLWRTRAPLASVFLASLVGVGVYGIWWFPNLELALWGIMVGGYALSLEQRPRKETT